jgi:hypothetical protein
MDFNLIRLAIEKELESPSRIQLVLNETIDRNEVARKKAFLFVNGIYQAIDSGMKRGRKMLIKWTDTGMLVLDIESISDVEYREMWKENKR